MIAEERTRLHLGPVGPHARRFGLTWVVPAQQPLRGTGARVA